jgi:NTP pyrophosphatase (non-canonical NTP hydrolase)
MTQVLESPDLTFGALAAANRQRCESPEGFNHALASWSTSDWMTATMGELGEAANVVKKLNRFRDGIPHNKETQAMLLAQLREELGGTIVYLDLLCQSLGFSMGDVARDEFNRKSADIDWPIMLR